MPPFRLGMLGMWHTHAHGIVKQVAAHPDEFELVRFYDDDPQVVADRRQRWLSLLNNVPMADSPADLLRQPLDGVVVEGRVYENIALAQLALESGKPVLLEKPAGTDLAGFRQLSDLADKRRLHLQLLYLFRYMPAVQKLLRFHSEGRFGDIYQFRARLPKPVSEYDRFVKELATYKGGMFFEMAGHVIDMMTALLGRPTQVTPFLAHHHHGGPDSYIDNGLAVFAFDRAWGVVEVPALEVAPSSRRIEVFGSNGACVIPHLGSGHLKNVRIQRFESFENGTEDWQCFELPDEPLQIRDLREFVAVVHGEKPPDFSREHDLIVQESLVWACGA